jgi:fructoselysine-6-P-deglycase FrlB-like protein
MASGAAMPAGMRAAAASLESDPSWVARAVEALDGADAIDVVAPSDLQGAAEQTALMLREAPRLRAVAWDAAEWLHTAVFTALPGHVVLLLGRSVHHEAIAETVAGRAGRVVRVPTGGTDAIADAIALSPGIERLAAALWERATAVAEQSKAP